LVDALTLADRIVVLDNGVVVDAGTVDRVLRNPRSMFAADLAGANIAAGRAVEAADGTAAAAATATETGPARPQGRRGLFGSRRGRPGRRGSQFAGSRSRGSRSGGAHSPRPVERDVASAPVAVETGAGTRIHGGTIHGLDAGESAVAVFSPK